MNSFETTQVLTQIIISWQLSSYKSPQIMQKKFGQLNINKHMTNAKLHKFQQIDRSKKSKSAPKFR